MSDNNFVPVGSLSDTALCGAAGTTTGSGYRDGRTRTIQVCVHLAGAFAPCGKITFNSACEQAAFTYDAEYAGPPLDPVNLDYRRAGRRVFPVDDRTNQDMLHRVFVDHLPGPWGISVLQAQYPQIKTMRAAERLHWFGSRTIGAMAFIVERLSDEHPVHGVELLEKIRRQSVDFFLRRIDRLDVGRWELDSLSAHGGARPKCLVTDEHGGQWLAKFNLDTDPYNYARVEHAASVLARHCGINAVETRCQSFGPDADILFVRRYDRNPAGRAHKVSAFSLMRADIVRAQNEGDYQMLFQLLESVSCSPEEQQAELFRRMLYNIAINNTDDHLKNFEMLADPERHCFQLSPAFDLTVDPYPNQRITSAFGLVRPTLDNDTLEHILRQVAFPRALAYRIRDQVATAVGHWREVFAGAGVDALQISRLERAFAANAMRGTRVDATPPRRPAPC